MSQIFFTNVKKLTKNYFNIAGGLDKRRSTISDRDAAIPLIEYSLVEQNGGGHLDDLGGRGGGHYSVPDRGRLGSGTRPKVNMSDNRRSYEHANHIGSGGHMGNHVDSEAVEADESLDYYPDGGPPRTRTMPNNRGYVKYNSFANY